MTTTLPQTAANTANVKVIAAGYTPDQLVNGIKVGTRHLIVSRLDLVDAGFPVPPKKGDRIYLGEAFEFPTTIQAVDADHREYLGCYDIITEGA